MRLWCAALKRRIEIFVTWRAIFFVAQKWGNKKKCFFLLKLASFKPHIALMYVGFQGVLQISPPPDASRTVVRPIAALEVPGRLKRSQIMMDIWVFIYFTNETWNIYDFRTFKYQYNIDTYNIYDFRTFIYQYNNETCFNSTIQVPTFKYQYNNTGFIQILFYRNC